MAVSSSEHEVVINAEQSSENEFEMIKISQGWKCCTRHRSLRLAAVLCLMELAVDVIEIGSGLSAENFLRPFMAVWLGSAIFFSTALYSRCRRLRSALTLLIFLKTVVFCTIRVYLVFTGLVDLEIVLGLVINALNMGITTTMFNFFYYFPVWDDNFVDKVKRRLLVLSTIGLIVDFTIRTTSVMLFFTNMDIELSDGRKLTLPYCFLFILGFEALFLPFLCCHCGQTRFIDLDEGGIEDGFCSKPPGWFSILEQEDKDGMQAYLNEARVHGDSEPILANLRVRFTLTDTQSREIYDFLLKQRSSPSIQVSWLERGLRLLVGWILLSVSQIGFLLIRPSFPVRGNPTFSSCHVKVVKVEHMLRYVAALTLTIIVRYSDNIKVISKADLEAWFYAFCGLLLLQLTLLLLTEYLESPLFVEKDGWVTKATDDLGWVRNDSWHWLRYCHSKENLTVDVPTRKFLPTPVNTPGFITPIPKRVTGIVSVKNASKTPQYYTTLRLTTPAPTPLDPESGPKSGNVPRSPPGLLSPSGLLSPPKVPSVLSGKSPSLIVNSSSMDEEDDTPGNSSGATPGNSSGAGWVEGVDRQRGSWYLEPCAEESSSNGHCVGKRREDSSSARRLLTSNKDRSPSNRMSGRTYTHKPSAELVSWDSLPNSSQKKAPPDVI